MEGRVYGWKPQPKDYRDLSYGAVLQPFVKLPPSIDLRPNMPPIYDQGQLGSCTAHGIARAFQYAENKAGIAPSIMPSRLFLYYNERMVEGTTSTDSGAVIRDGIKVCNQYGVADENLWPYDISKFTEQPPVSVYNTAKSDKIRYYASINNHSLDSIKICLYHGYPIIMGFQVYQAFERYTVGILEKPGWGEQCLGGHCVCIAGYDDDKEAVLIANSWGPAWGIGGYFYMSYEYLTSNLCSDFWMMRLK